VIHAPEFFHKFIHVEEKPIMQNGEENDLNLSSDHGFEIFSFE